MGPHLRSCASRPRLASPAGCFSDRERTDHQAGPPIGFVARVLALAAAVVGVVTACGDDPMTPAAPDPPVPTTVAISPTSAAFHSIGDSVRMIATVSDQYGQAMANVTVEWSSSDTAVATVAEGLVSAVGNGSATVTATAGTATASAQVEVDQLAAELAVSPTAHTLVAIGDTVRFVAEARDGNGNVVTGAEFVWSSDDESVVTVDSEGLATAAANGTARVTATSGSQMASAEVSVEQEVAEVSVSPPPTVLGAFGDTVRLSAEATDANGHLVAGTAFTWTSGDTLIAMVDDTGLVTAVGNGEAEIMAASGAVSGMAAVTVAQKLDAVAVLPSTDTLEAFEDTVRLLAEAMDSNGHAVAGTVFAWTSGDTLIAMVDSAGLVTAVGNGRTEITAASGAVSGTATVTIAQQPGAVVVTPSTDTLVAFGDTVRLSAEAMDANGHTVSGAVFTWVSGDMLVAVVDGVGLVTAVGNGRAEITAATGAVSGTADLTVAQVVAAIEVVPAFDTLFALDDTVRLSVEVTDANGNPVSEPELAWLTGDGSVATVDSTGLVTAVGNGATEVGVTVGEVSGRALITVKQAVAALTVSPATATLSALGETVRLVAVPTDATGNPVSEPELTWSTDDGSVATVDSTGLVTAVGNGATEVGVVAGNVAASATVNVRQNPSLITVSPATGAVWVGRDDLQLTAMVFDANGHELPHPIPIRWSSSDPAVASVEPLRGVVTAVASGAATIAASVQDAIGTATITVRTPRLGPYPINVTYLGDVPSLIRQEMDKAVTAWGRWLTPTLSAEYLVTASFTLHIPSDLTPNGFELHLEAGDTLAPGLNVWVTTETGPAWGWARSSFLYPNHVRSDVKTAPWAVITFNWQATREFSRQARRAAMYETALHEIGHAVGIGTSPRWWRHFETPDTTKPWASFFTDSLTIAVFDKMGGTDFPSKKIPLHDPHHWDGCAGHFDLMGSHIDETSTITELTLAAMADGYEYDHSLVPRRSLDPNVWNWDFGWCKDGLWQGPSAQAAGDGFRGFEGDVIHPGRRRR
ncbi:MAG: Ig domain-containing protein [Gemmatimonadetes bacterium]|nr:Ig domain-containing protein [Gemmatimonadota bacterium]